MRAAAGPRAIGTTETPRRRNQLKPRLYPNGVVYFIREEGDGPIKIGWTTISPEERLRTMQTGNPRKLVLLGYFHGGQFAEGRMHSEWARHQIRAEWYRPHPALLREIEELVAERERADVEAMRDAFERVAVAAQQRGAL